MSSAKVTSVLLASLIGLPLVGTAPAQAQKPVPPPSASASATAAADRAAAEQKFEQGKIAFDAAQYETALASFQAALALFPSNGSRYKIASTEEKLGRVASAWKHFSQLAEDLPEGDARKAESARKAGELEKRLPKLRIRPKASIPPSAKILIVHGATGTTEVLFGAQLPSEAAQDPGACLVHIVAAGFEKDTYQVDMKEGQTTTIELAPLRGPGAAPAPSESPTALATAPATGAPRGPAISAPVASSTPSVSASSAPRPPPAASPRSFLGPAIAFGVAGAGLLVGAITGGLAMAQVVEIRNACGDDLKCPPQDLGKIDTAYALAHTSTVGFIVAGVGAAIGVSLWLLPVGKPSSGARVGVVVTPGFLRLEGGF